MRISDWSSDVCSSDLMKLAGLVSADSVFASTLKSPDEVAAAAAATPGADAADASATMPSGPAVAGDDAMAANPDDSRSEEHTSELQSLMRISSAVFCLKKTTTAINNTTINHMDNEAS